MATASGPVVSLDELLDVKEERAARQAAALSKFGKPLVSVTIVMPGPVKDGWFPRRAMEIFLQELDTLIGLRTWPVLSRLVLWRSTGPEGIYVIDADARVLKSAAMDLEERHPIGRLWDIDVITTDGAPLSRAQMGVPARQCLLCGQPARECGRSRRHSLPELIKQIRTMVNCFDLRA